MKNKKIFMLLLTVLLLLPLLAFADDVQVAKPIDLTPIINAAIALCAALVTAKLLPLIRSKTTAQQRANMSAMARTFVFAAEQLYGAGHGDQKLGYVLDRLKENGYEVQRDSLRDTIEEAVKQMNSWTIVPEVSEKNEEENE